ncbi:MAG: hypothetical protein SOZ00_04240 [Tidjanibacter sp.]|nr:hypothetical protein [Tidjanibacter sp.]
MKNTLIYVVLALTLCLGLYSCESIDVQGGTVNSTEPLDITTFEYLSQLEETAVVAQLFERAGLKDAVNGEVTVIAPSKYAVNRYLRRHNSTNYIAKGDPAFTLESMDAAELAKMNMYIYPGKWWRENIPEDGVYLTSIDGLQEIRLSLDATNTDPGAAYDGGGVAGSGFQYSNFLMSTPYLIHVLFKRGVNWELDYLTRVNLGLDSKECDQSYRMYISDVRTTNGVVHIIYMGDTSFSEHYYYHTLFFFGTRSDDV